MNSIEDKKRVKKNFKNSLFEHSYSWKFLIRMPFITTKRSKGEKSPKKKTKKIEADLGLLQHPRWSAL